MAKSIQRQLKYEGNLYNSLKEAAMATGISKYLISKKCIFLKPSGRSFRVKCINTGTVYENFLECRQHLFGIVSCSTILSILKHKKSDFRGIRFEYTQDDPTPEKILPIIQKEYWWTDGNKNILSYIKPEGNFVRGKTTEKYKRIRDNKFLCELLMGYINEMNLTYLKRYLKMCSRGYDRGKKSEKNYHIHHIIPQCMGGSNNPTNLTKLTYREHYLAHYLLYRSLPNNEKSIYCWITLNSFNAGKQYKNSRLYELTIKEAYEKRSLSGYGNKISKIKISQKRKLSEEQKKFISERTKEAMKKVPHEKLATQLGSKWITNGQKDTLLKKGENLPNGFWYGKSINKTDNFAKAQEYWKTHERPKFNKEKIRKAQETKKRNKLI